MKLTTLYIASQEPAAGSLIVTMGLMELLGRLKGRIALFRPVVRRHHDSDIRFLLEHYAIDMDEDDAYGYCLEDAEAMIAEQGTQELIESLIGKVRKLEEQFDFVVCEGLPKACFSPALERDLNIEIATNLGAGMITVHKAKEKTPREVGDALLTHRDTLAHAGCYHVAAFTGRGDDGLESALDTVRDTLDLPLFCLPELPELDAPTLEEVRNALGAETIMGFPEDMDRLAKQPKVAAMHVGNLLPRFQDGDLVITPGDRDDILLATVTASYSGDFPTIAGMLLTGGIRPRREMTTLIRGIKAFNMPVILTDMDTYDAARAVSQVSAKIHAGSERKIALATGLFSRHVDTALLEERLALESPDIMTPLMFQYTLFEKARQHRRRIVLPESDDERILRATEILLMRGVADITLLGNESEVRQRASAMGLDLDGADIIDPETSMLRKSYAARLHELRKHKGLSLEEAHELITDVSYFATMMVQMNDAHGMVSGAAHTTQETVRPALQIIKTRPGISIVSSIFLMCMKTEVLAFGDCAINLDPGDGELAQIAIASARTAKMFGITPRVAMLSYSTGGSGQGEDVEKVRRATEIVRNNAPDLAVDGPLQYDAAVDADVAAKKLPDSPVAGRATVLIFPDLNTGNNTYKAVQRSSGAVAIGPVLQGLNKPVNDLSRGCLVEDIVNTVAITAIQAENSKEDT